MTKLHENFPNQCLWMRDDMFVFSIKSNDWIDEMSVTDWGFAENNPHDHLPIFKKYQPNEIGLSERWSKLSDKTLLPYEIRKQKGSVVNRKTDPVYWHELIEQLDEILNY